MKPTIRLLLLVSMLIPSALQAASTASGSRDEIELGSNHESLDKGYSDWDSYYLDALHRFEPNHAVYGELRETRRFNLYDREVSGGYIFPFNETWNGMIEASVSPDHNVLPKNSLFGQLQKTFSDGWDIQAGFRRNQYNLAFADMMVLTGERYWGDFRAAYTFYLGKLQDAGAAPSHAGQFSYYYADHNFITLNLSKGRQVESQGVGLGVLVTDVTSFGISGRYWLDPRWGLSYEAMSSRQGDLYTRKGIRLGIRYAF